MCKIKKIFNRDKSTDQKNLPFYYTDKPSATDLLNISHHINGLAGFLIECDTPMTVSIQGKWGSGKTSIMGQIKDKIQEEKGNKFLHLWIDTWQFSQFPFDDQLSILILNQLISEITKNAKTKQGYEDPFKFIKTFGGVLLEAGKQVSKHRTGIDINQIWEDSVYSEFENFRDQFKEALDKTVHEKFIIYIDDLDRLVPEKAVELLEALKVFFDVDKCVFVLAIDYEVVSRGVAAKYGFDMNNIKELEKGEEFFDKIIQVSYRVPLKEYDYGDFINNFLKNEKLNSNKDYPGIFENLLISSVGKNPRSIKKILNTFKLNKIIKGSASENSSKDTSEEDLVLFAFMCMQTEYPFIYSYIYDNIKDCPIEEIMEKLLENNIDIENTSNSELIQDLDKSNASDFLKILKHVLEGIKDEKVLAKVLIISRTTFLDKNINNTNKQDHKASPKVQYIIRKMFNRLSSDINIDVSEGINSIFSNLALDERTDKINENQAQELDLDYVQLTQGKGQGIYLIKGDKYAPDYKIYFSGDNRGNLPNDGLRFIKEGEKAIITVNSNFKNKDGEKYLASNLIDDESSFDEFFNDYIEKVKELQEKAGYSKVIE